MDVAAASFDKEADSAYLFASDALAPAAFAEPAALEADDDAELAFALAVLAYPDA